MESNEVASRELNTYLRGEYMAIDSYEKYLKKINDPKLKREMENILEDHKNHARMISERITHLGGTPAKTVDLKGKMGEVMNTIKNIGKQTDEEICREAYYWEKKGTEMAREVVKGDLDQLSCDMIQEISSTDMNHLDTLENYF